ncbi:MAG TPA: YbaB/EbfC family nucleoid-associated protein [Spirillospora sp.]|nr:YbaB/EbfC family nucleoid-associated protein [Spirillospora sp.]
MPSSDGSRSLNNILNDSTPFAPANESEIRSRIEALQAPQPEPEEVNRGLQGPGDEQDRIGAQRPAPEPSEGPPAAVRVDFSDSRELINDDRRIEALSAASTLARVRAEQAEQFVQEQRRQVFSAASADGRVNASVDGTGRLVSLDIDDALLRGSEARLAGRKVVEAVTAATAESIRRFSAPDWSTF